MTLPWWGYYNNVISINDFYMISFNLLQYDFMDFYLINKGSLEFKSLIRSQIKRLEFEESIIGACLYQDRAIESDIYMKRGKYLVKINLFNEHPTSIPKSIMMQS